MTLQLNYNQIREAINYNIPQRKKEYEPKRSRKKMQSISISGTGIKYNRSVLK